MNDVGVGPTSGIEDILQRFEDFDPGTAARGVYEELISNGWVAYAPTNRDGSASKSAYLRLVYSGKARRRVTLYLNTQSLVTIGAKERQFAAALDAAEVHNKDIYIYHSEGRLEQALAAAEALRRWADGEQQ